MIPAKTFFIIAAPILLLGIIRIAMGVHAVTNISFCISALAIAFCCLQSAAATTSVAATDSILHLAVYDFQGRGIDSNTAIIFSDRFRAALVGSAKIKVLERSEMDLVLNEQGFQKTGACDYNACLVEMGQLLGIQFMVAGAVGKVDNIFTFNLRMINIESGEIIYAITHDAQEPLAEILSSVIGQLARQFSSEVTRVSTSSIKINSSPAGAMISVNSKDAGATPCALHDLDSGLYALTLSLATYEPLADTIILSKGMHVSRQYGFKHTKEYFAQIKARNRRFAIRFGQGSLVAGAIACLGTGAYYEYKVRKVVEDQEDLISAYNSAGQGTNFSSLKRRYAEQSDLYDRYHIYRNIGWIGTAIFAAGFTVTVLF